MSILNFCLMTSANYLTKALVMYDSLLEHCKDDFKMYYFCFDTNTYQALVKLEYENIIPIHLKKLEEYNPRLLKIKNERTISEYFFTCSPQTVRYVMDTYLVENVIYIDADLYFYQSPKIILNELKGKDVLITEHWYYPKIEYMPKGKYCVQFIPFNNNNGGREVLNDWAEKCLDWCYMREEDGKWADQGYLNFWSEEFDQVVEMKNRGAGMASWNIEGYEFWNENNKLKVFSKEINKVVDPVFFHFHGLKIFSNGLLTTGIPKTQKNAFNVLYKEYINKLSKKEQDIMKQLKIKCNFFNYENYSDSNIMFFLREMRRIFLRKPNDIIYYFKFLKKYRWLP